MGAGGSGVAGGVGCGAGSRWFLLYGVNGSEWKFRQ